MQVMFVSNILHMRSIAIFLLTTFITMSTYSQSNKVDVHGFDKVYELEKLLSPINIQGEIWQAHAMASDGEYLFVVNDKEVPPIKSYRLADGKYMGGFGSVGGGPGEFVAINRSGFGVRKDKLIVQGRKYIRIFNLVVKGDKLDFQLEDEIRIPKELGILNQSFLLNDYELAARVMFSPKEFITLKLKPNDKEREQATGDFGDYPNYYPDIPNNAYHHLYWGRTDYSHDGKFLVKAYSKFPLLRVFDLSNGSFNDIELEPKSEQISKLIPDQRGKSIANGIDMFSYQKQVKISKDFILSDYQESITEMVKATEQGNARSVPQTDRFLLLFSIEGELLAKFTPPDWFQKYILTPDNKLILFHPEIENQLFTLDLNQFK